MFIEYWELIYLCGVFLFLGGMSEFIHGLNVHVFEKRTTRIEYLNTLVWSMLWPVTLVKWLRMEYAYKRRLRKMAEIAKALQEAVDQAARRGK